MADLPNPQDDQAPLSTAEPSLLGLAVDCSGLTLASPTDADVASLMGVYSHDFDFSGTTNGTDLQTIHDLLLRRVHRHRRPEANREWRLELVARNDTGAVVGWATLGLVNSANRAALESTSWVAKDLRGQGNGTSIRHGVLALAFNGLHADVAISSPLTSNERSIGVSTKLGYTCESMSPSTDRNSREMYANLELTKQAWEPLSLPAQIQGSEPLRDWLVANVFPGRRLP